MLDLSVKLYRDNFGTVVMAGAVALWPLYAIDFLLSALLPSRTHLGATPSAQQVRSMFELNVAAVLLNVAEWSIAVAVTYKAFADALSGGSCDWRHSVKWGARRLGASASLAVAVDALLAVTAALLMAAASAGTGPSPPLLAALAWFAAALFVAVSWPVAAPSMMAEGNGPMESLATSRRLVAGRRGRVLGVLALAVVVILVLRVAIALVVAVVGGALFGSSTASLSALGGIASVISAVLMTPAVASLMVVLYSTLRGPAGEREPQGSVPGGI